jgi:predicted negative regulator of RcsB-dependent stress response
MTKHPAARRVHRQAAADDVFVAGVLESSVWAREHARKIVIGVVVAVVAILAVILYRNMTVKKNEAAALQLDRVRATVQSGNAQLARQDLQRFLRDFGGTRPAEEASLMLGEIQLQAGELQNAIATLQPLTRDVENPLGYNAALMLASAYELNKQNDQADRLYLRLGEDARFDYQKREALNRAAHLRAATGNPAGAVQLYERILATFDPKDTDLIPEKNVYAMRLAELRAQLKTGS